MDPLVLQKRANTVLQHALHGCVNGVHSSHTVAIYDTAWVSMISKKVDGEKCWLFPESFRYLLKEQKVDGGWESHGSDDDDILSSLAALLAMKRHENNNSSANLEATLDITIRTLKATTFIQEKLQHWTLAANTRAGFEILVPALLSMLEQENVIFKFPRKDGLTALNENKLKTIEPKILYEDRKTLLHSLEAFVGKLDFDRIQHHKTFGSMMGSPASTAAYLMNRSVWDADAEDYLRNAISNSTSGGEGSLPSVYPSNIFELTWVLSTLFRGGFTAKQFDSKTVSDVVSYLKDNLQAQDGLLGFTPSVLADADDTAMALITLSLLGHPLSPTRMISYFETDSGHFRTYVGERDASFSASCNVLNALVHGPEAYLYTLQIGNVASFLCDRWFSGNVQDKWNLSPYYSMMLLAETFVRLLQKWDGGQLNAIEPDLVCNRVPQVLIQLVNRKLLSQKSDGTWGPEVCPERDAYAILTLLATTSLPHVRAFELKIQSAIHSGRHALLQCESQWAEPQYLWIEKVIYGSSALAETYCISAMNAKFGTHQWTDRFEKIAGSHSRNIMRLSKFFSSLPTLRKEPSWKILVSVVEGFSFLPQLLDARSKIFPRRQSAEDKYLEYIPCTWIVINNCDALCLEPFVLWDMMVMSMLDFLVDEYMESTVAKLPEIGLHLLCSRIPALCKSAKTEASGKVDQTVERSAHLNHQEKRFGPISAIETVLKNYIGKGLDHPRIQNASSQNKLSLQAELQTFLLSHLEKIHDNIQLRQQQPQPQPQDLTTCFLSPRSSHYVWSHTTAAYHTSCALSFNFYICLLKASSPRYSDFFERADEKYLAQDLCAHLGTMTRLYNDYGSIVRDRTEVNLNSTNFPEFHLDHSIDRMEPAHIADTTRKKTLLSLAEYEKRQAQAALQSSTDLLGGRKGGEKMAGALRVFARVTELYADMYVVRDLTNRVK